VLASNVFRERGSWVGGALSLSALTDHGVLLAMWDRVKLKKGGMWDNVRHDTYLDETKKSFNRTMLLDLQFSSLVNTNFLYDIEDDGSKGAKCFSSYY